jgi:TatD DNase family protein
MPLIDSHCHLQDSKFDDDREEMIARSLETLDWMVVIGDDLPTSRQALEITRDRIYASVGVHPYYAAALDETVCAEFRNMANSDRVVAIGEIGLDYFKYNETPKLVQETAFRTQLELAVELNLPVVIHNRDSTEDLCCILDDYADRLRGGVIHCFAGSPEFVTRACGWGFYISFAGNVTFPKAEELRVAAKEVPLERLLVETDAPYLAPQAVRGKRCEPAYVKHTAEFLAGLLDIPYEELARATTENASRLYNVPIDG